MKYGFIAKYRNVWPTRTMCRVLGVSSSGFYDWFERPPSQRERHNAKLLQAIKERATALMARLGLCSTSLMQAWRVVRIAWRA